jgi:putative methyltransferase (TIGR04325 family)
MNAKLLDVRRVLRGARRTVLDRLYPANAFLGVYGDFAEAQKNAPATKALGYDLAGSEDWYQNKIHDVLPEDYPVLFWLRSALADSRSVFEIGGHIGEAHYAFGRLLTFSPNLSWTILDVPTIVEKGKALARERGANNLDFVSSVDQVEGADILFAAGALQYIEKPSLAETIAGFSVQPKHILINVTPVYDGPAFVTLQNIGSAYCPYRIFNRDELVQSLKALGYRLVDAWHKDRKFKVRFYPDKSFDRYSGFYFTR